MNPRGFLLLTACSLALAGCHHRAPKASTLPPAPPDILPVMVSVPPPTHPTEPLPSTSAPVAAAPVPVVTPPRRPHKKKAVPTPPPPPPQVAVATITPAAPISLGQLSAGGDSGSGLRSETDALLTTQKLRLEKLSPAIVATHPTDVEQARRFLKGAEDAWKTGDVEGAHTLGVKAKVLVDDLSK